MLQKLNERIQGWIAWVVIGLVAVTFLMFGLEYLFQSRQDSQRSALTINGESISQQELELKSRRRDHGIDEATLSPEQLAQGRQRLINDVIQSTVSVQAADKNGFDVTSSQANAATLQIPQFQDKGSFSAERYDLALRSALFTPQSFQSELRQGMVLNQQRFAIAGTAFAVPEELEAFVALTLQTRDYRYLTIASQPFLNPKSVSEDAIEAYYQQHAADFVAPESVAVDYVSLSIDDLKAGITLSEDQLKQFYVDNPSNFTVADKTPVQLKPFSAVKDAISEQLLQERAQTLFAQRIEQLADLSYQNPESLAFVSDSLNLPVLTSADFTREQGPDAFTTNPRVLAAAFNPDVLTGHNSDLVQVDPSHVVVLHLRHRRKASTKALSEVKALIIDRLAQQKAQAEATALGQSYVKDRQLTASKHLAWLTVKKAQRDGAKDKLPIAINQQAFAIVKPGDRGGIALPNGDYAVVELSSITPGSVKGLDKEQLSALRKQLQSRYGLIDYDLYVEGLVTAAKIKS